MAEISRSTPGSRLPFTAKTAVAQWRVVKHDGADDMVSHETAAAGKPVGVAVRPASKDEPVEVQVFGVALVQCAAAVTRGVLLKPAAAGKATPVSAANDRAFAVALASGVKDDVIPCVLTHGQVK